jgi:lysophospholipase L1-like esterase
VQFIGRFDTTDAVGPRTAWPGARIVARFDGTDVDVKLTQTDGFSGGPTYFNIILGGAFAGTFSVTGTQTVKIASGLAAGAHTIEIEKRTEAPFGTVRFEGFTFAGGAGLLAPPVRLARKLEFLGDSTIDGYGIDGSRTAGAANYCGADLAPPNLNDVRKSVAWKTASDLSAELNVLGYSGKGIARNEDGQVLDLFPTIYARALPDVAGNVWGFASFVPDVVVVSLGGSDYSGDPNGTFPGNFGAKYADLVAYIRARYGAAPYVFLTVWSQHKSYNNVRESIGAAIDAAIAGRPAGERTSKFVFPEADPVLDETGCQYHANPAHHAAMAALLVAEIKAVTGWP